MPQTTIERKYFLVKIAKFLLNTGSIAAEDTALTRFKRLQKNITGGKE